ncbi:ribbon-helix-helix protein, CopG family [Crinalium epipsammum]
MYDELKKSLNLKLTPTAIRKLENLAIQYQLSRSELIERVLRGIIKL